MIKIIRNSICAYICLLASSIFAVTTYTEAVNGITWTYTVSNGVASVGGGTSSTTAVLTSTSGSIIIPSVLGGYPVTHIGNYAFMNCSELTNVAIPDSVTSIGDFAFSDCSGLTSVTIPNSVTNIVQFTFYRCSGLTSVTIPDSVTSIGHEAFRGCSGLTSVHITDLARWCGVTFKDYESNPLYYASNLYLNGTKVTTLTIPDSVTSIGGYAFVCCRGLTSVTIPDSVTSIGEMAFGGCYGLTRVTIPDSVTSIGDSAFSGCRGLTNVTIGGGVTSIGSQAFAVCSGLTSMTIPNGVTNIGERAFGDCSGISSFVVDNGNTNYLSVNGLLLSKNGRALIVGVNGDVTIPNSVTSIGNSAFYGYSGLTNVTIPDSVTNIGHAAFCGCTNLTSVTIPNGVMDIGTSAFYVCSGLTSLTIPDSVTSIGELAFGGCHGLTSVTIPNGVKNIVQWTFRGCSGLTSVTIPDSVTNIWSDSFYNCGSIRDVTIPQYVLDRQIKNIFSSSYSSITNISYSSVFTNIGNSAFSGCSGLTSVTIPESVTSIGESAFSGCSGLTSVTIPDSVTSIGVSAFSGCSGLTSVAISDSVTSIGRSAFYHCSDLKHIFFYGDAPAIGLWAFTFVASGCCAYVRRTSTGWDVDIPGTWAPNTGTNIRIDYLERIVLFDANGGEGGICNSLDIGADIVAPTVSRTGYTFVGWSPSVAATVPTNDVTYLAQWEINKYTVTFHANGGTCGTDAVIIEHGATIGDLPVPTRKNAVFAGWFTEAEGGDMVDASLEITEAMTLYARWRTLEGALDVDGLITVATSDEALWTPIIDSSAKVGDETTRSGEIGDRTNTWLSATVSGAGTMSFWCKVSCEHDDDNTFTWDRLMVYTNDVEVVEWRMDGETDWTRREVSFAGGENTVKWVYFKDRSISEGEDCAWVDGVTWTQADVAVDVGGGKSVLVPMDWIDAHSNIVTAVGGDKSAAMKSTAANGRKVWECYVLGLDPEKTGDFKITSFPMKSDGTPDLSAITFEPAQSRWNLSGATPKLKGKATLDAEWQDVPPGGNPSFRFFTVEVQMP